MKPKKKTGHSLKTLPKAHWNRRKAKAAEPPVPTREAWDVFLYGPAHGRVEPVSERGHSVTVPVFGTGDLRTLGTAVTYRCKYRESSYLMKDGKQTVLDTRVWIMDAEDVQRWYAYRAAKRKDSL